jgi:hypothetical protein
MHLVHAVRRSVLVSCERWAPVYLRSTPHPAGLEQDVLGDPLLFNPDRKPVGSRG